MIIDPKKPQQPAPNTPPQHDQQKSAVPDSKGPKQQQAGEPGDMNEPKDPVQPVGDPPKSNPKPHPVSK